MSTNNNNPIDWDSGDDKTLLGSLFPNELNRAVFQRENLNKSFAEFPNEYAMNSPFGKDSLFYTELKGDFFDGFVEMLPILYKIGAPMPEQNEVVDKKGILLDEVIITKNKLVENVFDYKKYSQEEQDEQNYWEYWKNNFAGQAILNKKIGYIDTEKVFFDKDGAGFNLYIPYKNDGQASLNNPNIDYLKANAAIKLTQLDPDAFLIILSNLLSSKRKTHVENILKNLVSEIEAVFKNKKAVEMLFDIPIGLLRMFKKQTVENLFFQIIELPSIPDYRESILINLLKVLPEKEGFNATSFLNSLVKPIENGSNYFFKLYDLMNDWGGENNFSQLIIELTKIWSFSVYKNPLHEIYNKYEAPAPIAYNQNYILGFRNDNYDFEFENTTLNVMHNDIGIPIPNTVRFQKHHIFQPIELTSLDETEAENLKLSTGVKLPAFYLKAFDDKSAWENFEKSIWLTVDIVSLVTGVGNLLKLRYLIETEKAAYIIIKTTIGIIQVASPTLSIGLSLIENSQNKDVINKIREYLFWVEICTLGADVLSTKILSKKASEAKNALDDYREILEKEPIKNKEFLDEIDEFSEHLDEVAELDNLGNVSGRGRRLGQRISKSGLNEIVDYLKRQGCDFEIFPVNGSHEVKDFIGPNGKAVVLEKGKQAAFVYTSSKMKFVVREGATVYETLHEVLHFKHAKSMGLAKYHSLGGANTAGELIKEQRVFDKMIENKDLLTRKELEHALNYLNKDIYNIRGMDPIELPFDINKIPEVRKEINIKTIFNLK